MYLIYAYSLAEQGDQQAVEYFKVREFACKDGSDTVLISPGLMDVLHSIRQHFNAGVSYRKPQQGRRK